MRAESSITRSASRGARPKSTNSALTSYGKVPSPNSIPRTISCIRAQSSYPYSKCIIASGSVPTPVGFPRDCGYAPLMLRTMDDAERLKAAITNSGCKRMLVSGTSMVSLKTVEACLNRDVKVTLVGIMDHVLDMNALPQAAERFERGLITQGVTLKLANPIKAVDAIEDAAHPLGRRLEVTFANGDVEGFDEIFVAHGMRNNLGFVEEGSLAMDRGIIVDEFMRSSDPDVYAAGDVVQATELISGEKRIVGIWKNAALQGACAGRAIAAELAGRRAFTALPRIARDEHHLRARDALHLGRHHHAR